MGTSGEKAFGMALKMSDLGRDTKSRLGSGYLYRFGQFALDCRGRTLSRADSPISLTPKAFDVLLFLAQNPNRLATKEELLQAVWGDTFVEKGNLTRYISHLRKALGDNSEDTRLIVTITQKGYRFTADVTVTEAADTAKQAVVQMPSTEGPQADTLSKLEGQIAKHEPRPKHWRKAALLGTSAVILLLVGCLSWRHFREIEHVHYADYRGKPQVPTAETRHSGTSPMFPISRLPGTCATLRFPKSDSGVESTEP